MMNTMTVSPKMLEAPIAQVFAYLNFYAPIIKGDHTTLYFRGEPMNFPKPFMPKIWRDNPTGAELEPISAGDVLTRIEQDEIEKFKSDHQSGEDEKGNRIKKDEYIEAMIGKEKPNSPYWISAAQHYGYKTRLVDVTINPLVALFFACNDKEFAALDGVLYCGSPNYDYSVLEVYYSNKDKEDYQNIFNMTTTLEEFQGDDDPYKPDQNTGFSWKPMHTNERMIAQQGFFLWCKGSKLAPLVNPFPIPIEAKYKPDILKSLASLNITSEHLNL